MGHFSLERATETEAYEMFIQIIQGTCRDADTLHRQLDMWRQEQGPMAEGWLGGTYGITDDDKFVGVVRFESKEAAARNSTRPEQGAWWAETEKCFDGEVTFHDCDEAMEFLDGGADDAGFVPGHPGPAGRSRAVPQGYGATDGHAARGPARDHWRHHRD